MVSGQSRSSATGQIQNYCENVEVSDITEEDVHQEILNSILKFRKCVNINYS